MCCTVMVGGCVDTCVDPNALAIVLARRVLPVPGGPCNRIPCCHGNRVKVTQ